jgi:hypothetical protein
LLHPLPRAPAFSGAERGFDERLVFQHDGHDIKGGLQIDRTIRLGEHHCLFRRQGELASGGVVFEIPGRCLL